MTEAFLPLSNSLRGENISFGFGLLPGSNQGRSRCQQALLSITPQDQFEVNLGLPKKQTQCLDG